MINNKYYINKKEEYVYEIFKIMYHGIFIFLLFL